MFNENISENLRIYVVKIQRLKGNGIDFNIIRDKILNEQDVDLFNGLPKWAAKQQVRELANEIEQTHVQTKNINGNYKANSNNKSKQLTVIHDAYDSKQHDAYEMKNSLSEDVPSLKGGSNINQKSFIGASLISGLSLVSKTMESIQSDIKYVIKNPLVVLLGIGDYDDGIMPSLTGITQDYLNMIHTFHVVFGYSITFENKFKANNDKNSNNNNDKYSYYSKKNKIKSLRQCQQRVKTYWTDEEIEDFYANARQLCVDNKHDSCIFIISSHGESNDVILSSKGVSISLGYLFGWWNGMCCPYLVDKPKLIFVDACRGSLKSKPIQSIQEDNNSSGNNINGTMDVIDELATRGGKGNKNETQSTNSNKNNSNKNSDNNYTNKKKNYHVQANFRYIYGNPQGYAVFDGGLKGGYLVRSIKKIMMNEKISCNKNLDDIVKRIRIKTQELAGNASMECVEDVNTMGFSVFFEKK